MKPYADAGLTKLAELSGHRSETLTSLVCSHFRRTHNFLLQAFEAFYRFFIGLYLSSKEGSSPTEGAVDDLDHGSSTTERAIGDQAQAIDAQVETILTDLVQEFSGLDNGGTLDSFRAKVSSKLTEEVCSYSEFKKYMEALPKTQDTIRFWYCCEVPQLASSYCQHQEPSCHFLCI